MRRLRNELEKPVDLVDGIRKLLDESQALGNASTVNDELGDARMAAPARSIGDFRERTLAIASVCAKQLLRNPDRNVSQVYRDMIFVLSKIEDDHKDPAPRPEDVATGARDFLALLPELCSQDEELRTLALDVLKTLSQATPQATG